MGTLQRVYDARRASSSPTQARTEIDGLPGRPPPGRGGAGRLRPAPRLRRHPRGGPVPVRRVPRPLPRTDRGPVNIQEQVDHLIDTRPGKELLHPGLRRPGPPGRRRARLPLGRHDRRLPAADRRAGGSSSTPAWGSRHRTTSGSSTPSGPVPPTTSSPPRPTSTTSAASTCSRSRAPTYVAQANNPACQADDTRIRGLRMRTAGIWFDMLGTDATPDRRTRTPASRCASREPIPDITVRRPARAHVDGLPHRAARRRRRDRRLLRGVASRRTGSRSSSNLFGPLFPALPEPQHHPRRPVPVRRAPAGDEPDGPRAAAGGPRHRSPRAHRRRRPHRGLAASGCTTPSTTCTDAALDGFNAGTDVWTLMR